MSHHQKTEIVSINLTAPSSFDDNTLADKLDVNTKLSSELVLEEDDKEKKPKAPQASMLMFTVGSDYIYLAVGVAFFAVASLTTPGQTMLYGEIFKFMSKFLAKDPEFPDATSFMNKIRLYCGILMITGVGNLLFCWIGCYFWMKFGERQQERARVAVFNLLLQRKMDSFDMNDNFSGKLTQVHRSIEELRSGCAESLGGLALCLGGIIALLVTALYHSWSVALIMMSSIPLMGFSTTIFGSLSFKAMQIENSHSAQGSKVLDWAFNAAEIVRVFNGQFVEMAKFKKSVDLSTKSFVKHANFNSINVGVIKCLVLMMFVQGFWWGNYQIEKKRISISELFTTFTSCLLLGGNIAQLSTLLQKINQAKAGAAEIEKFIKETPESEATLEAEELPISVENNTIEFSDVSFKYPTRENIVLDKVSAKFDSSALNFIIGKSGCGKSTMFQLLTKSYKPQFGSIMVNGVDINNYSTSMLSSFITTVSQSSTIFNATVRDNICMAVASRFETTDEVPLPHIQEACNFALLDDVIEYFEDGFDSMLTPRNLSGGQQQRIEIARAKLRDTPVLILDESLSALDSLRKGKLMRSIRDWRKGRLTIMITHDLEYLEPQDNIVLVEDGKVGAAGKFESLADSKLIKSIREYKHAVVMNGGDEAEDDEFRDKGEDSERNSYDFIHSPYILKDLEKNEPVNEDDNDKTKKKMMKNEQEAMVSIFTILMKSKSQIQHLSVVLLGIVLAMVNAAFTPVFSYCFAKLLVNMVNVSVGLSNKHELLKWSCVIIGISVGNGLTTYLAEFVMEVAGEKWVANMKKTIFEAINDRKLDFFADPLNKPAILTGLLMNDARDLRNLISIFLPTIFQLVSMLVAGLVWMFIVGWKLSLVGISFIPLVMIVVQTYSMVFQQFENRYKTSVANIENSVHETYKGIKWIFVNNSTSYFARKFNRELIPVKAFGTSRAVFSGFGIALTGLCTAVATGTLLYFGMKLISTAEYNRAQFLQVVTLFIFTVSQASILLYKFPDIAKGKKAGNAFLRLLELSIDEDVARGTLKNLKTNNTPVVVELKDTTFKYAPTSRKVLNKVSFQLKQGSVTGIAGLSGSGKSTIALLLFKLYEVSNGMIYFWGQDIKDIDTYWLRSKISFVPQHAKFFEGTIFENLIYGIENSQTIPDSAVLEVLKLVNLFDYIVSLPEGIYTRIGEGNLLFSGGQLQRLAIARAVMKNPTLLVLDECTSNLDVENTDLIGDAITRILKEKKMTILAITHDNRLMEKLESIMVLSNGKIIDNGSYNEVCEKHNIF